MKYSTSFKTHYEILAIIADKGSYPQYDLGKAINKSYRTVLRHLELLETYGLIHLLKTEPAKKGGKERKIYTLTLDGLIALLKLPHIFDDPDIIDTLANNFPHLLPLVFGKWSFFKKAGVKDIIVDNLKKTIENMPNPFYSMVMFPGWETRDTKAIGKLLSLIMPKKKASQWGKEITVRQKSLIDAAIEVKTDHITKMILFTFNNAQQISILLKIACEDKDLWEFYDKAFSETQKQYEDYLKNIRSWSQKWEEVKKTKVNPTFS